jgi:hypothetical protein
MLTNTLLSYLDAQNLRLDRFREITTRLFAWGVVLRDEDGVEQRLYDDALRIEDVLSDYFSLAGFRLVHDTKNEFFRLYPPGAQVPGIADDDIEPAPSLRARLSADVVAAALALRFLYQQGLAEGGSRLTDTGEVLIRFDELAATLQTQIKRPLPESPTERKSILADLKRHRIIQFTSTFSMTDEDALIAIRPTILGIIGEDALSAALENSGIEDTQEEETDMPETA